MFTEKLHLGYFRYHCCFETTNYIVKKTTIQLSKTYNCKNQLLTSTNRAWLLVLDMFIKPLRFYRHAQCQMRLCALFLGLQRCLNLQ